MKKEKKTIKSKGKGKVSGPVTTQKASQKQETKINIKIGDTQKKKNAKRGRTIYRDRVSYVSVPGVVSLQTVPQPTDMGAFPKAIAQGLKELFDPKPIKSASDVAEEEGKKEKSKVEKDAEALREKVRKSAEDRAAEEEQARRRARLDEIMKRKEEASKTPFVGSAPRMLPSNGNKNDLLPDYLQGAAAAAAPESPVESPAEKKRGRPKIPEDQKKGKFKFKPILKGTPMKSEGEGQDIRKFFSTPDE